ncbi:hypothetical protein EV361DRAFT_900883 [Lentinula raphanica]|uniref:Uncharacterized protein n=1 Tax=Lentinula raphanica TaxID=153919 RepID=A0AA38PEE5_9AGAR|nr:hypothetical protein F5880DRAFT_1560951 [Lentinula raphanica]KAJ3841403.1 hypothetical protein F5878DRAFT_658567 [Lentinula raphanica]KAJ3973306.1 hypothetical protein EV361DRAFT_900883 [Lentinula raphanica]
MKILSMFSKSSQLHTLSALMLLALALGSIASPVPQSLSLREASIVQDAPSIGLERVPEPATLPPERRGTEMGPPPPLDVKAWIVDDTLRGGTCNVAFQIGDNDANVWRTYQTMVSGPGGRYISVYKGRAQAEDARQRMGTIHISKSQQEEFWQDIQKTHFPSKHELATAVLRGLEGMKLMQTQEEEARVLEFGRQIKKLR